MGVAAQTAQQPSTTLVLEKLALRTSPRARRRRRIARPGRRRARHGLGPGRALVDWLRGGARRRRLLDLSGLGLRLLWLRTRLARRRRRRNYSLRLRFRGLCLDDGRRRFGRRLIAFHELRGYTLGNTRHASLEHRTALAGERLLRCPHDVEFGDLVERVEPVDRVAAGEAEPGDQSGGGDDSVHRGLRYVLALSPESVISTSMRARVPGGVAASVAIRSSQRLAAAASPLRHAERASSSRAVWRNGRSAVVSGSSVAVSRASGAVSTRISPSRMAARSRKVRSRLESVASES